MGREAAQGGVVDGSITKRGHERDSDPFEQ